MINANLSQEYLTDKRNPRWVVKPTVAYLWARTVACKNCRATIPLLKTRWLCKKDNKRVVLTMAPKTDRSGVDFGVQTDVPVVGTNEKQRRDFDRHAGLGTMTGSGVRCPVCNSIVRSDDLRLEGKNGALGLALTAVVVDNGNDRDYRLPTETEILAVQQAESQARSVFADLPHGMITEPIDPA